MASASGPASNTNCTANDANDGRLSTDNNTAPQICWLFSKQQLQNTPSSQAGLDALTERRYRRQACELIMKTANQLALGHETMATGIIFFHRFFMFHSLTTFNRYAIATTCLFLAGKVEETPKKCRDVIKIVRDILQEMQEGDIFGPDPRDDIVMMEKVVLQTLKFDFTVEHPHKFLAQYYKIFKVADKQRVEKLCQMAWAFANDASLLTLPLEWEPEIIAVATFHLAAQLQKFNVHDFEGKQSRSQRWWDGFVENLTTEVLDSICHDILDMYEERKKEQAEQQQDSSNANISNAANGGVGVVDNRTLQQHHQENIAARRQLQTASSYNVSPTTAASTSINIKQPSPKKARISERPRSPPRMGGSSSSRPPPPPPPSLSSSSSSAITRPAPPPPPQPPVSSSSTTTIHTASSLYPHVAMPPAFMLSDLHVPLPTNDHYHHAAP